jgi:hypothetical protein
MLVMILSVSCHDFVGVEHPSPAAVVANVINGSE